MLTPPAAPPPGRRAARLALLAALAVYMLGGPINGHLLGNRHRAWMHWGMYSTAGRDVCSIRFFLPGEESAPVDRLGSLGYAHSYEAPTKVRRLRKASGVRAQGAALCEALGVDDPLVGISRPAEGVSELGALIFGPVLRFDSLEAEGSRASALPGALGATTPRSPSADR